MAVARAEGGKGMSTDDADPGNPSSPDDSRDGEQSQDLQPGQPAAHELELDAYGVPVQDRPPGRAYLLGAGCFFFGVVSASLGVMRHLTKLPHPVVAVGVLSALTMGMAKLLEREDERSDKRLMKQHGWLAFLFWAGLALAFVGFFIGYVDDFSLCHNNCGPPTID